MNDLILGIALLMGGAASLDDGYVEIGVAAHQPRLDAPEIDLSMPLGTVEAGVQRGRFRLYYEHISGLTSIEEGGGLNMIGVKVRLK